MEKSLIVRIAKATEPIALRVAETGTHPDLGGRTSSHRHG